MGIKQGTTIISESPGGSGKRNQERLSAAYEALSGDALSDDGTLQSKMREWYTANVLNVGTDHGNPDFSGVSLDYGAPNLAEIQTDGSGGSPSGPYQPGTGSPGEGEGDSYSSIPAVPARVPTGNNGSTESPSEQSVGTFNLTSLPALGESS